MSLTLDNLMTDLRKSLRIFDQWSVAHATGDAVTTRYKLPDYPVINPESMFCTMQGEDGIVSTVTAEMYELDAETGWFSFFSPPDSGTQVQWTWQYIPHNDEELLSLVNAGIRYIAADIKRPGLYDDTIETELEVYEYAVPEEATRIKSVEIRYLDTDNWEVWKWWRTINLGGRLYIKFMSHPGIWQVRCFYEAGPSPFEGTQTDGVYTETFPVATGLPDDAYDPVLHYCIWIAMHRAVTARSRDDAAQHVKGESAVTMRDLETRTSAARSLFELHLSRFASELEHGRIVPS